MTDQTKKDTQSITSQKDPEKENQQMRSGDFREMSYVVLFIGAVFIINAMETGSYSTPWPIAIIVTLAGLGLFGYSWLLKSKKQ